MARSTQRNFDYKSRVNRWIDRANRLNSCNPERLRCIIAA